MSRENILSGKAWVVGDYMDVYKILAPEHWKQPNGKANLDPADLGQYALLGADPKFVVESQKDQYSFIVAGRNFGGGGKSTEQPIMTLKGAGIKAVIAESCSRYFFRNAVNNGLFVIICSGITANVKSGDVLQISPSIGEVKNLSTGLQLSSTSLTGVVLDILNSGGYLSYIKTQLKTK